MGSQTLFRLLHLAEDWVKKRFMIQDFCLPENNADQFLNAAIKHTAIFPLWLCPIKAAKSKQIFAPHLSSPAIQQTTTSILEFMGFQLLLNP